MILFVAIFIILRNRYFFFSVWLPFCRFFFSHYFISDSKTDSILHCIIESYSTASRIISFQCKYQISVRLSIEHSSFSQVD